MTNQEYLEQAITLAGGAAKLAARMGVTKGFITQVRQGRAQLPLRRALQIEQITEGSIKFDQIRPDFRDLRPARSTHHNEAAA